MTSSAPAPHTCPPSPGQACGCDCYGCDPLDGGPRQHCNPPREAPMSTTPPRMTTEDVVRIVVTGIAAVGLALLVGTLAGAYGWVAAGALLFVVGMVLVWPLYRRKFDEDAARREVAEARGGQEPFRGVPPAPTSSAEDGGGQSFPMPGG